MHKTLLTAALSASVWSALAQGTIYLNNRIPGVMQAPVYGPIPGQETLRLWGNGPSEGSPLTDPLPLDVTDYLGAPRLEGSGYTAELWSFDAGTWSTVPGSLRNFRLGAAAGYLQIPAGGSDVEIPGVLPSEQATLQLRAWENLSGTPDPVETWAEAMLRSVPHGYSAPFQEVLGGSVGAGPSLPTPNIENLRSFNLAIPEPAAWATIGGMGLLGFAVVRRRRQRRPGEPSGIPVPCPPKRYRECAVPSSRDATPTRGSV